MLKGRARFENQKRRMEEYIEEQNRKKKEESPIKEIGGDKERSEEEKDGDVRTQWGGGVTMGNSRGTTRGSARVGILCNMFNSTQTVKQSRTIKN